jgi:hypothetical protein
LLDATLLRLLNLARFLIGQSSTSSKNALGLALSSAHQEQGLTAKVFLITSEVSTKVGNSPILGKPALRGQTLGPA